MRNLAFIFGLLALALLAGCVSYQVELVSENQSNSGVSTQLPNYVNMLVRVTNRNITTRDGEGNTIPDFSNPEYYVVGLEQNSDKISKQFYRS